MRFERMLKNAEALGIHDAAQMTMDELNDAVRHAETERRRRWEELDVLAWMIGQYAALAVHAPSKYPKKPLGMRKTGMSDAEMKEALKGLVEAERG